MNNEQLITPGLPLPLEATAENETSLPAKPDSVAHLVETLKVTAETFAPSDEINVADSSHLERQIIRKRTASPATSGPLLSQQSLDKLTPDQKRTAILLIAKRHRMQRVARLGILHSIANSSHSTPKWMKDYQNDAPPPQGR